MGLFQRKLPSPFLPACLVILTSQIGRFSLKSMEGVSVCVFVDNFRDGRGVYWFQLAHTAMKRLKEIIQNAFDKNFAFPKLKRQRHDVTIL
jgi:hypothetical protein